MVSRFVAAVAALLAGTALASPSQAACATATTGALCVAAAAPAPVLAAYVPAPAAPALAPGDVLEPGGFSVLLNAAYYGLPPAADGWVYVRAGRQLVRMDWRSRTVIDDVTAGAGANF